MILFSPLLWWHTAFSTFFFWHIVNYNFCVFQFCLTCRLKKMFALYVQSLIRVSAARVPLQKMLIWMELCRNRLGGNHSHLGHWAGLGTAACTAATVSHSLLCHRRLSEDLYTGFCIQHLACLWNCRPWHRKVLTILTWVTASCSVVIPLCSVSLVKEMCTSNTCIKARGI